MQHPNEARNRILLVDDDTGIQKVIRLLLENAGFDVAVAASGQDALDIISGGTFEPDCIILDIRMPGMPGTEVLPRLKKLLPKSPVIMQTALSDIETGLEAMRGGAFDYLVKPAMKAEIIETVKKALAYRNLLLENERLESENREYQHSLEAKVQDRTRQLNEALSRLQKTNLETVRVLAETIEAKDPYTRGHCNRVRQISLEMTRHLDLSDGEIEILEYGALLHDIGKLGISEGILHKETRFTPEEVEILRAHPIIGENILKTVEFFKPCLSIVRHHHEWYNGGGYPDGIREDNIDILIRIVSLSDAFDAMTSDRPYRKALELDKASEELIRGSGTQFDPELVDLFFREEVHLSLMTGCTAR